METIDPQLVSEDVQVADNVDELFELKMKQLREIGLYDDRMMDKVNLIKDLESNPTKSVPKGHLRRGYVPLGRFDHRAEELLEFNGDDERLKTTDDDTEGNLSGFKPIESGLKWSLPIYKRKRCHSPNGSTSEPPKEDRLSSSYQKSDSPMTDGKKAGTSCENNKQTNFHNFFESRKKQNKTEESKTEIITDIEAFIRDCNKKAEPKKPHSMMLDDIDDFLAKYTKRLEEISAHFDRVDKK